MADKLSTILTSLPALTHSEKQIVDQELKRLLEGRPGTARQAKNKADSDKELFYSVSATVMAERGLACPPWPRFQQMNIAKHLKIKFPDIQTYTERYFGKIRRGKKQALYRIYAELLLDWMDNHPKVPFKVGVYFQNLNQIPTLVADAFPNYANEGWLPMILELGRRDHRNPPMEE